MLVYLNGEFLSADQASVPVGDRGFLFGDGIYEVTRSVRGELFAESAHWRRLRRGLDFMRLEMPPGFGRETVRDVSSRLTEENGLGDTDATVYLQITRGVARRTHWFPDAAAPTVYLFAAPFTVPWELRERGARVITHADQRWARCDIKTVNLLPNVLAKQRARDAGAWEALLVRDGVLLEGASTNLFALIGGELRTAPRTNYILPGVTREIVISLADDLGIPVRETPIFTEDLDVVEEMFLTGTTTDIQPIVEVDGRPVGGESRGPATLALQDALYAKMGIEPHWS